MIYKPGFSVFFLLFASISVGISQPFNDPVSYNDFIVGEQEIITNKNLDYLMVSVHSNNIQLVEGKRIEVMRQIDESINKLKGMPDFEGDVRLRDEAISVLEKYLETFQIDFNDAQLLKQTSENSFEAMEKYFMAQEKAEHKLNMAGDRLEKAQKLFAEKHDMIMVEDEKSSSRLKKIAELNNYTRKIHLLYFKVSKTNAGFLDAMNAENAVQMEKKRAELEINCQTAINILTETGPFRNDPSLLNATLDLVNFHADLSKNQFKILVELIKKKDQLSQEDVDNYNSIIDIYNQESGSLINRFNEENSRLMKKNIPEPGKRT